MSTPPPYDPKISANKGLSGAASFGSTGIIVGLLIYLVRANVPQIALWPESMDVLAVGALTGVLSGVVRAVQNWLKHRTPATPEK